MHCQIQLHGVCIRVGLEAGSSKVSTRFYPAPIKIVAKWYELEDLTNVIKFLFAKANKFANSYIPENLTIWPKLVGGKFKIGAR